MNLDKIMDALNFAYRQKDAVYTTITYFKNLFNGGFSFKRFLASFLVVLDMFGSVLFGMPTNPKGEPLDLTGYSIVFCDEFDGNSLNTDVWAYRASGPRRNGANAPSQVKVENGKLTITGEYLENGEYGEGWYAGMISLKERYTRGYFEIRCICNKDKGFWSAFWLQAPYAYNHELSNGGIGGAEIDIFEAMNADKLWKINRDGVSHSVHCNGVDDDVENIDSLGVGTLRGKNIYDEYNTYGLKWTEDEYIFYINGVESARTSFGKGTSTVPEEVIVSLEIPNEFSEKIASNKDYKTQMIVDYVKIYQQ